MKKNMKINLRYKTNAGEQRETMGKHRLSLLTMCQHTPLVCVYMYILYICKKNIYIYVYVYRYIYIYMGQNVWSVTKHSHPISNGSESHTCADQSVASNPEASAWPLMSKHRDLSQCVSVCASSCSTHFGLHLHPMALAFWFLGLHWQEQSSGWQTGFCFFSAYAILPCETSSTADAHHYSWRVIMAYIYSCFQLTMINGALPLMLCPYCQFCGTHFRRTTGQSILSVPISSHQGLNSGS